ncbi:MAG: PadR family transcriptional regulator [Candidatus Marsarchaeota archaeon]|nr:PadR family transcriptional regulator [Candidatus Marsarchaeota archaeon]
MPRGYCRCGPFRVDIIPKGLLKPLILKLLSDKPMHGFELMEQIFEKTDGMWRPGPAAIYPTLEWLESNGYIRSADQHERKSEKARKQYAITKKGSDALSEYESSAREVKHQMQKFGSIYERI